jgi:hypothetical protein
MLFTELGRYENCFTVYTFNTSFNSIIQLSAERSGAIKKISKKYSLRVQNVMNDGATL